MKRIKNVKTIKVICCLFAIFVLAGCSTRVENYTVISTKNIDLNRGGEFKLAPERIHGEDVKHMYVIIPDGVPQMNSAINNAMAKVPGTVALVDAVVEKKGWWIPGIYGVSTYEVNGTPLIDPAIEKHYEH